MIPCYDYITFFLHIFFLHIIEEIQAALKNLFLYIAMKKVCAKKGYEKNLKINLKNLLTYHRIHDTIQSPKQISGTQTKKGKKKKQKNQKKLLTISNNLW